MDEADIYYVDTRNAEPIVVSRTGPQGQQFIGPGAQGFVGTQVPMATSRYGRPTRVLLPHAVQGNRYAMQQGTYPSPYMVGSGAAFGAGMGMGLGAGGLFGGMTGGQLVDLVAQIFAAVMPLPAAPNATSDPSTDVPNLITYQTSLAQYAKRDEQIRTLGNLVTKLLG